MQYTRRLFVLSALLVLTLNQTGCKTTKTKVTFENRTGVSVDVDVSASLKGVRHAFKQNRIANGKSYSKQFIAHAENGQVVYAQGKVKIGQLLVTIPADTLPIVIGSSNTFRLAADSEESLFLQIAVNGRLVGQMQLSEAPTTPEQND